MIKNLHDMFPIRQDTAGDNIMFDVVAVFDIFF